MNSLIFEQIDNAGFIRNGEINTEKISKLTPFDIIEFAQESAEITSASDLNPEKNLFTHSASMSLGAGRRPCSELGCRLDRANELSQFAAFYSDKIYMHNFIAEHLRHLESKQYPDEQLMRMNFVYDMVVFDFLRPFIEAEIIIPITAPNHCPHCFVESILKDENDTRLKHAFEELVEKYNKGISYSIQRDDSGLFNMRLEGSDELLNHGFRAYVSNEMPIYFKKGQKALKKRLLDGEKVILSKKAIQDMEIDVQLADEVFRNAYFSLSTAHCLNTSFVTERELDISFINSITPDKEIDRRNAIIKKHLTCLVPFIDNIKTSDILKIRKEEGEAFLRFRGALNIAINESLKQKEKFTENTAREIYQDVIRPELANLEKKAQKARKSIIKDISTKIVSWGIAAIGIGIWAGIPSSGKAEIARSLGLLAVLQSLTEGIIKGTNTENSVEQSDMYFLWKVKKKSNLKK